MAASRIEVDFAQLQKEVSNCEKALHKLIQVKKMMSANATETHKINRRLQQNPVAIIGMASIFPQSKNLREYWEKIIRQVDCITDVPPSRWNIEDYYDPNPKAPDKTYCKRGGFIPEIEFNPMEFGLPPNLLEVTDVSQLLGLVVAKAAIEDAGYGETRQFNRERTGVILGVALARQLAMPLATRLEYPIWEKVLKSSGLSDQDTQKIIEKIKSAYVPWEENAFPGMLANIVSGRIANRLDLGGMNCVVDAACASSLGALAMSISELVDHRADMMLTGGVDTDNSIVAYMCFSKTPAVSPSQNTKPFDAQSDGMMLAEGIGMLVLKRLEDAIRDNDRIYAVIKGIGASSDGRYKSIYAPRPEGQVRALHRAYEDAGFSPTSVGLIEAHGTGTMVGDPTEFTALKEVFSENNSRTQHIALGSVKSQIGHAKAAAGAASLIKTALALHHKVLPATINITQPHPKLGLENSPLYLNTETRPWICSQGEVPRRAGVSSFGFGGTNYHIVLEEYSSEHDRPYRLHNTPQSVLLFASTPEQLRSRCQEILGQLQSPEKERSYAQLIATCQSSEIPATNARVGFVAESLTEACKLLQISIDLLTNKSQAESWEHPQGIYYRKTNLPTEGKVVALFSGQGSQYLEMGRELVINFPCLRQTYSQIDNLFCKDGLKPVSEIVFPRPVFDQAQKQSQVEALQKTEYAQAAIGAFSVGLYKLLQQGGFKPDFLVGHSFGELTALWAAGVLSEEDYFFLVKARGQAMAAPNDPEFDAGAMLAVKGDVSQVEEIIKNFPLVTIANLNSPNQVVLAGAKAEISQVQEQLKAKAYSTVLLPVSAAFHTPLVTHAQKPFTQAIEGIHFNEPIMPVYTNVTGKCYPQEPQAIQKILKQHLINQVHFKQEIENIYAQGGYCFIEFGPKGILTKLVKDILCDQPHLAVALNGSYQKDSDRCFREAVMQLRVAGLSLKNPDLYQLEQKTPEVKNNKQLIVQLNGSNYISEKRKQAFEKALHNGHQVNLPHTKDKSSEVNTLSTSPIQKTDQTPISQPVNTHRSESTPVANGNKPEKSSDLNKYPQATPKAQMQTSPELTQNYQLVLDSLEYSLIEFNRNQRDALHVHEQSLKHQTEYTKTFFQLMQQQNSLLVNDQFPHQDAETKQIALSYSERSIMRFHEHHGETLRVHEQYLNHQTEQTKKFFQLLQQHYSQLLATINTEQPTVLPSETTSIVSDEHTSVAPVAVNDRTTTSVAVPTHSFITNFEPVLVNGTSNGVSNGVSNGTYNSTSNDTKAISVKTSDTLVIPTSDVPSLPITIDEPTFIQTLLNIVSEKTGYPVGMLELSMDIEVDLGIDAVKRVEILGSLLELYPYLSKPNLEELEKRRSLGQIVEYLRTLLPGSTDVESAPGKTAQEVAWNEAKSSEVSDVGTRGTKDAKSENIQIISSAVPLTFTTSEEATSPVSSSDLTDLSQILLNVVSEKTGYPVEMLELSMDMEADLGIDSIKRVEILGGLLELCPDLPKPNPEELGELRTLSQIVDYMKQQANVLEKKTLLAEPCNQQSEVNHNILRSSVHLKFLPEPDILDFSLPEKYIALLTDDGTPMTSELALALLQGDWKVVVLSFPKTLIADQLPLPEGINRVVLANLSEEHLQHQLEAIASQYGQIAAFIHLNPDSHDDTSNHVRYLETEKALLRHVFLIAKHLKTSLNQAASQGCSCFLSVARLDGQFGLGCKTNFGAISSGLFGLTKSLNQEWETVFCRAIDLSPDINTQTSVQYILNELHDPNRLIAEVGYSSQGRTTLVCKPERWGHGGHGGHGGYGDTEDIFSPLSVSSSHSLNPQSQVFLVSGGARGITAECVIKLAQCYQCKFILLGRSPVDPEPVWAEGCSTEGELKKRIMDDFIARGEKPTPAMVQKKYKGISSRREIQATLRAIEKAGGQAEYLSVDITDATQLQEQVATAVERLGEVTGIIHGAGNLADKRIENKSERDFEIVYAAKVAGLENMLHCVSPSQLNYLVLFSSVVGFYGNIGQSDYAIANEILNKSAHLVKRNYPNCHVVAINWGPWDSGMVTPELKKAFAERSIETIPIELGTQMLVNELAPVNQQTTQVVIGSPLVYIPQSSNPDLKKYRIQRRLILAANPFLQDHVIAGRPVLPATCALTWIANTCEQLYPGYKIFSCSNFKVLKGIVFDKTQPTEYILDLQEISKNDVDEIQFDAKIWSKNLEGKTRYHFSSQLKIKQKIPVSPNYDSLNLKREEITLGSNKSLYQNGASSLFHGASFQGVKTILNASSEKITLECALSNVEERKQGQFPVKTFNPYIADVQVHALWLWTQYFHQQGCLPSEIKTFEQFAPIPFDKPFYVSCEVKLKTESSVTADVIAHDIQGKVYNRMIGAKGTILPRRFKD
ncbi:MAG: SDR family NAD(P)-dependent oxidoreductase [Pelatocladus maniniholoensis HA4357-MV3]|jgi:acyl transferase domain-containing protein/acyl carrier protein|uniref:SDR family NAD(P)-dependent oxidoreductase n=1 Tax=Pelatocladus maniniholoensis HA4357-MV3 TaxID=1117104 RepID=A0A9E3LV25_9NOST|nr:SDR family NAD(P)-dependent oxidoreductase [Pelatocladus maniniholoensis HA4357-MV3]